MTLHLYISIKIKMCEKLYTENYMRKHIITEILWIVIFTVVHNLLWVSEKSDLFSWMTPNCRQLVYIIFVYGILILCNSINFDHWFIRNIRCVFKSPPFTSSTIQIHIHILCLKILHHIMYMTLPTKIVIFDTRRWLSMHSNQVLSHPLSLSFFASPPKHTRSEREREKHWKNYQQAKLCGQSGTTVATFTATLCQLDRKCSIWKVSTVFSIQYTKLT